MSDVQFVNLLSSLFVVKGIAFTEFEIYIWDAEKNKSKRVETLHDLEELDDFSAMFCLSNVQTSINNTPFNFEQLNFSCLCKNGKCCDLYLDPDVFTFNSEDNATIDLMRKMNDTMKKRLNAIAQALFALKSS